MKDTADHQRPGGRIRQRPTRVALAGAVSSLRFAFLSRLHRRRCSTDGPRWYQVAYWLIYRLGLSVWQRGTPSAELVALVEGPSPLPTGRALDLGCGTGTETIYLATHGWDVTGIDMTPRALAIARHHADAAGVAPRLVDGDVTRLDELDVGNGYTLLLDLGCFHTLPDDRRPPYVTGVSHAAAPGATLLLCGFRRRGLSLVHAGITVEEVRLHFCGMGWELVSAERTSVNQKLIGRVGDLFELWCYQLRRASS